MSLTLDAGALIAFERGDRAVVAIIARALQRKQVLAIVRNKECLL